MRVKIQEVQPSENLEKKQESDPQRLLLKYYFFYELVLTFFMNLVLLIDKMKEYWRKILAVQMKLDINSIQFLKYCTKSRFCFHKRVNLLPFSFSTLPSNYNQ